MLYCILNLLALSTLHHPNAPRNRGLTRTKAGKYTQKIRIDQRFCANF